VYARVVWISRGRAGSGSQSAGRVSRLPVLRPHRLDGTRENGLSKSLAVFSFRLQLRLVLWEQEFLDILPHPQIEKCTASKKEEDVNEKVKARRDLQSVREVHMGRDE
jgi:hypothetical protein